MNCFYHPTVVAVGTCKSCGKGLCPYCAVDLGKGLACKGRCEEDVESLIKLIDLNVKRVPINEHILTTARGNRYLGAAFYLVFGLLFIGFAGYRYVGEGLQEPAIFFGAMGLCFIFFGLAVLWRSLRFPRSDR